MRKKSIIYQLKQQFSLFKKRTIPYIISFYIALILPCLCLLSINTFNERKVELINSNIEDEFILIWESSKGKIFNSPTYEELEFTTSFEVDGFNNGKNIQVYAVDNVFLEGISKFFIERSLSKPSVLGKNKCLIQEGLSRDERIKIGDKINIDSDIFEVVGIVKSFGFRGDVIISYEDMKDKNRLYNYSMKLKKREGENVKITEKNILNEIKETYPDSNHIIFMDGVDELNSRLGIFNRNIMFKTVLAILSMVFFVVNQALITIFKIGENKKFFGLKLSLGVSLREIFLVELIESFFVGLISNLILILTITPIKMRIDTFSDIVFDIKTIFSISIVSIAICILMSFVYIVFISRLSVRDIISSEEVV